MEVLLALIWFGFWVWVLRGVYRWITRGLGEAFAGTWDTMISSGVSVSTQQPDYERREVINPPAHGRASVAPSSPAVHAVTGDLEATLREEEASATELARAIGDHRRSMAASLKKAAEWRDRAEAAVAKGRDDLARAALEEAQRCDEAMEKAEAVIAELQPILDSYEAEIDALRRQLDEGLRRKLVAEARMERARAGQRAARWLTPDAQAQMTEVMNEEERRADLAEGQWEAQKLGGTSAPAAFGRKGLPAPTTPVKALGAALTPLEPAPISAETERRWDAAIERQLAELKSRSGSNAA